MRRKLTLGFWYAAAIAGLLAAEDLHVSVESTHLLKEANIYGEELTPLYAGEMVKLEGEVDGDYLKASAKGKTGWIARSDVYSTKEYEATMGGGSKKAEEGQEGAYAKGFDPEVEKKAAADDATLKRFLEEEVKPLIYEVRGSKALEEKEEQIETFVLQHPLVARGEEDPDKDKTAALKAEWDQLNKDADALRVQVEPFRSKWAAELRAFRQAGQTGEFARSK